MTRPVDKCIFCGGMPVTKQHIWAAGLHRHLTKDMRKYASLGAVIHLDRSEQKVRKRGGDIHDLQVRCVCEPCNNGWMRRLENQARPTIIPLLDGKTTRIAPVALRTLAAWAAMNAMVMEYEKVAHVTTHHTQRKRMMRKQLPPEKGWKIYIGNFERRTWPGHWAAHPFYIIRENSKKSLGDPTTNFNGQVSTQVFKQLFIQVMRCSVPSVIEKWRFVRPAADMLRVIWPVGSYSLLWPPDTMGDREADYVASAFYVFGDTRTRAALSLPQSAPPAWKLSSSSA